MSPPYALETGLPVATLLAILVVCWYTPVEVPSNTRLATWIPMLLICPPSLAVTLAFILRGFRRRQTLGTGVVLVVAFTIFRLACEPPEVRHSFMLVYSLDPLRHAYFLRQGGTRDRWLPLGFAMAMVATSVSRGLYHAEVVACDERMHFMKPPKATDSATVVVSAI